MSAAMVSFLVINVCRIGDLTMRALVAADALAPPTFYNPFANIALRALA